MFIGDIMKVTTITFWHVELAFQGPLNGRCTKKMPASRSKKRKTYSNSYSEILDYSFFHIYLRITFSGSKRNPVGIRLEATECSY